MLKHSPLHLVLLLALLVSPSARAQFETCTDPVDSDLRQCFACCEGFLDDIGCAQACEDVWAIPFAGAVGGRIGDIETLGPAEAVVSFVFFPVVALHFADGPALTSPIIANQGDPNPPFFPPRLSLGTGDIGVVTWEALDPNNVRVGMSRHFSTVTRDWIGPARPIVTGTSSEALELRSVAASKTYYNFDEFLMQLEIDPNGPTGPPEVLIDLTGELPAIRQAALALHPAGALCSAVSKDLGSGDRLFFQTFDYDTRSPISGESNLGPGNLPEIGAGPGGCVVAFEGFDDSGAGISMHAFAPDGTELNAVPIANEPTAGNQYFPFPLVRGDDVFLFYLDLPSSQYRLAVYSNAFQPGGISLDFDVAILDPLANAGWPITAAEGSLFVGASHDTGIFGFYAPDASAPVPAPGDLTGAVLGLGLLGSLWLRRRSLRATRA